MHYGVSSAAGGTTWCGVAQEEGGAAVLTRGTTLSRDEQSYTGAWAKRLWHAACAEKGNNAQLLYSSWERSGPLDSDRAAKATCFALCGAPCWVCPLKLPNRWRPASERGETRKGVAGSSGSGHAKELAAGFHSCLPASDGASGGLSH